MNIKTMLDNEPVRPITELEEIQKTLEEVEDALMALMPGETQRLFDDVVRLKERLTEGGLAEILEDLGYGFDTPWDA